LAANILAINATESGWNVRLHSWLAGFDSQLGHIIDFKMVPVSLFTNCPALKIAQMIKKHLEDK